MNYWIVKEGKQHGPMSLDELLATELMPETLVWHTGLATWTPARHIAELASKFQEPDETDEPGDVEDVDEPLTPTPPTYDGPIMATQPVIHVDPRPYSRAATTQRPAGDEIPPQPPTYFGWCIAAIILCCMIPAIVALIYSTKVSSRYVSGDFKGAERASETTAIWLQVSIVCGLISIPFYMVFSLMG